MTAGREVEGKKGKWLVRIKDWLIRLQERNLMVGVSLWLSSISQEVVTVCGSERIVFKNKMGGGDCPN